MFRQPKDIIIRLLSTAGVMVNGSNPWDIQVYDDVFYKEVLRNGSLGLGKLIWRITGIVTASTISLPGY